MKEYIFGLLALLIIVAGPTSCTIHQQYVVSEAAKSGSDPVAIKCAMSVDSESKLCLMNQMMKIKPEPSKIITN